MCAQCKDSPYEKDMQCTCNPLQLHPLTCFLQKSNACCLMGTLTTTFSIVGNAIRAACTQCGLCMVATWTPVRSFLRTLMPVTHLHILRVVKEKVDAQKLVYKCR